MLKPLEFIKYAIYESLGRPMRLQRLLTEHPEVRLQLTTDETSIGVDQLVQWQNWGTQLDIYSLRNPGTVMGWRLHAGYYGSFETHVPELNNFGHCEVNEKWQCDIQDVTGLCAAKSDLDKFTSLDSMVKAKSPDMIDQITPGKLNENLAHRQIRILQPNSSDYFARYLWGDRTYLMNSGGAHHFAAARYIAARLQHPFKLTGMLRTYAINSESVTALQRQFDMYAMPNDATISTQFHEAMQTFGATYLKKEMPMPTRHADVIFLPKAEKRAMRVSRALQEAGIADLGKHLSSLLQHQRKQQAMWRRS